jgi:hypothetical protein
MFCREILLHDLRDCENTSSPEVRHSGDFALESDSASRISKTLQGTDNALTVLVLDFEDLGLTVLKLPTLSSEAPSRR